MSVSRRYECDRCGACCRSLIVEAGVLDALREPRILSTPEAKKHRTTLDVLIDNDSTCVILACGKSRQCPFLNDGNLCDIYPTRPNACVGMMPGDEQCQMAREMVGLQPLEAVRHAR